MVDIADEAAAPPNAKPFSIEQYLREEQTKDLFRFSTAGSVDDGKSTLIGRLLYDTQSVYDDQVRSIEGKGTTAPGVLDLALLTDGLRAEREQGITIDVAYRYFATARRKFIIADTPGHEQYTRNMATGASTADAAIVLVDARKGVLRQSRRHAYITTLLGVRQILVAVNKMDLVAWSETRFAEVKAQFLQFFAEVEQQTGLHTMLHFVPVSALTGENVVQPGASMPWYTGSTLLALLEQLPLATAAGVGTDGVAFRLAVQRVVRPNLDFRGYAGQIASGTVRVGDTLMALPSRLTSRVERIVTFDGDLEQADAPRSITLTLADEIDISRGDLLVPAEAPAAAVSAFEASLVWMDAAPMEPGRRYLLKQTSRTVPAQIKRLLHTVDLSEEHSAGSPHVEAMRLELNGIGVVTVETQLPLYADPYRANRHTGSFILIDPQTNATVAAGMIRSVEMVETRQQQSGITAAERAAAWGHQGAQIILHGGPALAGQTIAQLERRLFARGAFVARATPESSPVLAAAGALALQVVEAPVHGLTVRTDAGSEWFPLAEGEDASAEAALQVLEASGVLRTGGAR